MELLDDPESSAQTGPILHHLGCLLTIDWLAQDHLRRGALLEESGPSLSWSLHGRYRSASSGHAVPRLLDHLAPSKTHGTWIPIRICPPSLLPPPMPTSATLVGQAALPYCVCCRKTFYLCLRPTALLGKTQNSKQQYSSCSGLPPIKESSLLCLSRT